MMDYYGSIEKDHDEIKSDFRSLLKEKYNESILQSIIKEKTYSISGYNIFFGKQILEEYHTIYEELFLQNSKKLSLSYSLRSMDVNDNLINLIGKTINLNI